MMYRPTAAHRRNIRGVIFPLTAAVERVFGTRPSDGAYPLGAFFPIHVGADTWRHASGIWFVPLRPSDISGRRVNQAVVSAFVESIHTGTAVPLPSGKVVTWEPLLSVEEEQLPSPQRTAAMDVEAAEEGSEYLALHLRRERNAALRRAKIEQVLRQQGKLACEACGFVFGELYGDVADGFCEVHHLTALASRLGPAPTALSELAILCSNCHSVIHRTDPMWTVDALASHISARSHAT